MSRLCADTASLDSKISLIQSYGEYRFECGTMESSVAPRILERLRDQRAVRGFRLKSIMSTTGTVNKDRLLLLDIVFDKIMDRVQDGAWAVR